MADPINSDLFSFGSIDIFNQQLCIGTFYIFNFLMNTEREKGLETILVLTLVSLIAFIMLHAVWFIYLALGLLAIGILSKKITIAIGKYWFLFSFYFGSIMNYVIMFLIFSFILTPVSFLQRLVGHNKILKKKKNESNFKVRNHQYSEKDIAKPW